MVDYEIIEGKDGEVYLKEIDDNQKETKPQDLETMELTLIKAKKGEETQDAEVFVTYIKEKDGKKMPNDIQIKEYRKDGLVIYQTLETIKTIDRYANGELSAILSHLGINKEDEYYYEIYKIIRSIIYGNYIIIALYKSGYMVFNDPDSLGNYYYTLYMRLIGGKLPKNEYLEITQIDKIDPYTEKDLTLFSNIVDKIRQKIEIKAIKR